MIRIKKQSAVMAATFLFFVLGYIEDTLPAGQVFTFASLAIMLFFTVLSNNSTYFRFHITGFEIHMLAVLGYCALSMLWAEDPSLTMKVIRALTMVLLMMTAVHFCHSRGTKPADLLKIVSLGGYAVIIYSIGRYGWNTVLRSLADETRLSNEFLNANTLGMCAAYAIVVDVYYLLYEGFKLHNLLAIPSVAVLAASGSRKALLILVIGLFAAFVARSYRNRNLIRNFLRVLLITLALAGLIVLAIRYIPFFSGINARMNDLFSILQGNITRRTSGYSRVVYQEVGWSLFREHPLFGIGIHNASLHIAYLHNHAHLHNTVIELLACGGITGFLIYYSAYIFLLLQFIKYRDPNDRDFVICLILLLIRMVMSYGYIEYFSQATYFYYIIFWIKLADLRQNTAAPVLARELPGGI